MIEIVLIIASVVVMYRVANADNMSGVLWGSLTLVICGASLALPYPVMRVIGGLVVSFLGMFVYNCVKT